MSKVHDLVARDRSSIRAPGVRAAICLLWDPQSHHACRFSAYGRGSHEKLDRHQLETHRLVRKNGIDYRVRPDGRFALWPTRWGDR